MVENSLLRAFYEGCFVRHADYQRTHQMFIENSLDSRESENPDGLPGSCPAINPATRVQGLSMTRLCIFPHSAFQLNGPQNSLSHTSFKKFLVLGLIRGFSPRVPMMMGLSKLSFPPLVTRRLPALR